MNRIKIYHYEEHINEAKEQIRRKPFDFPKLDIKEFSKLLLVLDKSLDQNTIELIIK